MHKDLVALGYRHIYLALYVEDILTVSHPEDRNEAVKLTGRLHSLHGVKDLRCAKYILGIASAYLPSGSIFVSQRTYLEAALTKFGMHKCRPLSTPMEPSLQLVKSTKPGDPELKCCYLQAIGCLVYAMLTTCPDLCYSVRYLSRFVNNPSKVVWDMVIHIVRYITGTLDYEIGRAHV